MRRLNNLLAGRPISLVPTLLLLAGCSALPHPASDLDSDGIADMADRCPGIVEDGLDPSPSDGCANSTASTTSESGQASSAGDGDEVPPVNNETNKTTADQGVNKQETDDAVKDGDSSREGVQK